MLGSGFSPEDYEPDPVELWPDCWPSWQLFCEMSGQWRSTPTGVRESIDYTPLFMRMDRLGLSSDEWNDRFADFRLIESAALEAMRAG